ncbi:hypothetical protein VN11_11195 [Stenotrophomonas maltophilia]|nr:hypothetical protein VN11_11195 [Stenotrophomonas maltophilia]
MRVAAGQMALHDLHQSRQSGASFHAIPVGAGRLQLRFQSAVEGAQLFQLNRSVVLLRGRISIAAAQALCVGSMR